MNEQQYFIKPDKTEQTNKQTTTQYFNNQNLLD